jgi:hypothetical protein
MVLQFANHNWDGIIYTLHPTDEAAAGEIELDTTLSMNLHWMDLNG